MFSSYKHKESRLLSFKNGGGEKMGGEEREGGGSGEVSVEDGMLVKLEEMLKGVEGKDREVLEEVITEAFSGDEEALESAEEELGKLGEEVKEWMGADLSLEKVVVVGRLLGVEVSEEALSFVEGEVKEGSVETVGSGEEVKRWVEEVEAVEGVSVRVEGTVVVIEGGKKVMRVDGGKLRKLQLQGAVRSLVQRARLEKNIGEIEGERGLEGVEFSVVDTTKVKVVYGGVEQVVNLVNVENRWVRQMAVLRVVGRGVRERGEEGREGREESTHTTKGGLELRELTSQQKKFIEGAEGKGVIIGPGKPSGRARSIKVIYRGREYERYGPMFDYKGFNKAVIEAIQAILEQSSMPKVQLTERGQQWIDRQLGIANNTLSQEGFESSGKRGGLVDMSRFLDPAKAVILERYLTPDGPITLPDGRTATVKKISENGYKFALDITGRSGTERWYISEPRWFYDQFKNGMKFDDAFITLWKKDPRTGKPDKQTQFSMPVGQGDINFLMNKVDKDGDGNIDFDPLFDIDRAPGFISSDGRNTPGPITDIRLNPKGIFKAIQTANERRNSESIDRSKVSDFDLPIDEPIGYIGLQESNPDDPVMSGSQNDARYFPQMLKKVGYDMRLTDGHPFYYGKKETGLKTPYDRLDTEITKMKKGGVHTVYINVGGHGYSEGVALGLHNLAPEDLTKLFNKHKDCKFIVNTIACFGGGFERSLWDYKDPTGQTGRVRLFLQSSITSVNMEGRVITDERDPYTHSEHTNLKAYSSYYEVFLAYNLNKGMTYGKAHQAADQMTKEYLGSNPQTWTSTPDGGVQTAQNEHNFGFNDMQV